MMLDTQKTLLDIGAENMRKFLLGFFSFPVAVFLVVFSDRAYGYYRKGRAVAYQEALIRAQWEGIDPAVRKRLHLLDTTKQD